MVLGGALGSCHWQLSVPVLEPFPAFFPGRAWLRQLGARSGGGELCGDVSRWGG